MQSDSLLRHTRALTSADLQRVIEIDEVLTGRARTGFFEKRLAAALRQPKDFVYTGYEDDAGLEGFLLARVVAGEFGATTPVAQIDAIGVDPNAQHRGVGQALLMATDRVLEHKRIGRMETLSTWRNHRLLHYFDRAGFELAPRLVLEREVSVLRVAADEDVLDPQQGEVDYGAPQGDRYTPLAQDRVLCRSLQRSDLDALVRIDRKRMHCDRTDYYKGKLDEVFDMTAIRVSQVAEIDGHVTGFIMARVDFGAYARAEPVAVLDTLDVDPAFEHRGIGTALLAQLLMNLTTLRAERIRTLVDASAYRLHEFFVRHGFAPAQELVFTRTL